MNGNSVSRKKILLITIIFMLLTAALVLSSPVQAGGWVVITLDQLPVNVVAGQPYQLTFAARQHGQTPWEVPEMRIEARKSGTTQTVTFIAKPVKERGHYQAELLFPAPGRWEWGIQSGMFPATQPMPALEVTGAAAAPASKPAPVGFAGLFGATGLLAFAVGLGLVVRFRTQRALRFAGIGLLVLSGVMAFAFLSSANAQAGQVQPVSAAKDSRDTGQQLFLAKGCVVCHVNTRAIGLAESYSVNVGPNLSAYRNDPEYLRKFLANPKGPETTFKMPNLGLSPTEIDALVHFINDN